MTLRGKLLLAQAPLAIALALVGAASVKGIASLGQSPELILRDNYRSVLAADRMLEAEADVARFVLARSAGRPADDALRAEAAASFEAELRAQEGNITERGETEATRDLRGRWTAYQRELAEVLAAPPHARLGLYFERFLPASRQLQRAAREILTINQDAMQRKSDQARREAERTTELVVALIAAAVAAGLLVSFSLMARLLRPLAALSRTVRSIAEGDLDARAPTEGKDEIAALGAEFNVMAERLRQYRSSSLGELLQAQQASQAAIDSLPDPVLVLDANGAILHLNGAAEAVFRRAPGVPPSVAALDPDLRATIERVRAHVLAGKGSYVPRGFDEAVKVEGPDGARSLLPRASPLYSEEGSITAATIVLQDVTRLMRFDELKNDLVATVLDVHRADAGDARVTLSGVAGEHLPGVAVDRERIDLVLSNLVANAIRHTPAGGSVEVSAVEGEGAVRFEVKDTGSGIPPEYQDRIFEKFFRVPGAPSGGVGLGLYLSREIVEAHGGRIGVESAPGVGSRFWFTVPRADALQKDAGAPPPAA